MLKSDIKLGDDFARFIYFLAKKSKNGFGWQLYRSDNRNKNLQISGIIITGKLTNISIGVALKKNANVILTIEPISFDEIAFANDDKIDVLYKNDIFVFSFGYHWIFDSIYGRKILSKILGNDKSQLWTSDISVPHCYVGLSKFANVSSVLTRFKGSALWIPPKVAKNQFYAKVDNILIVDGSINMKELHMNIAKMIVTTEINSILVDYCWKNEMILAWVHRSLILNEVARDFAFYLGSHIMPMKIHFSSIHPKYLNSIN